MNVFIVLMCIFCVSNYFGDFIMYIMVMIRVMMLNIVYMLVKCF